MPDAQILAWLAAKERASDAEERIREMMSNAERLAKTLGDEPSTPFDPNCWPDASTVADALREFKDAQRAADEAENALTDRDRSRLKKAFATDF